jgi:hypothetical protein
MKVPHLLWLTGTATVCTSAAFGFVELGRGELLLATSARETYDSRVFGGANPEDDYIFTLEPRLLYQHYSGELKLDGLLGTRINRYSRLTELNSEDLESNVRLSLPSEAGTRVSGSLNVGYDERTEVNYDVNARVREKTFNSQLNGLVPLGLKTSLLLDGLFRHDQRNQFSDRETREGSAGFRYVDFLGGSAIDLLYRRLEVDTSGGNAWGIPLRQRSDMYTVALSRPLYHDIRGSVSYGYRVLHRSQAELAVLGPNDSSGSVFSVNLTGPFLPQTLFPKVETALSLGYQKAETPGINDKGGTRFYGTLHVGWHARERTEVAFDARRGRELSINDVTVETTSYTVNLRQGIGNFMHGTLLAGYEQRNYLTLGRTDNVTLAGATLSYRITKAWSADADYRFRGANSSFRNADYSRHVVMASLTYTF